MLVCLAALFLIPLLFAETRNSFFSLENQQNLWARVGALGVFAIGETFVIITAGIDLSVGSVIAFSGVLAAQLVSEQGWPFWPSAGLVLVATTAIGVIHGLLVSKIGMPAFVATLGTMLLLRSQAKIMTENIAVPISDQAFQYLYNGRPLGIPMPLLIMVAVAGLSIPLLRSTALGRYLYAVGANEEATRLSGVNVGFTKTFAYASSGLLAGLAGLIFAAYNRLGDPDAGTAYELSAIAAAVIGGCSLMGGQGSVVGTVIGAAILSAILNILFVMLTAGVTQWEGTVVGAVVILAVAFNLLRQRRGGR